MATHAASGGRGGSAGVGGAKGAPALGTELLPNCGGTLDARGVALAGGPAFVSSPSFGRRALAPLTAGGVRQSIFTLVQTAIGGGVLTISYMMRLVGLSLGAALLTVSGLIAFFSMDILMRGAVQRRVGTFAGLLVSLLGPSSGIFLDAALFLYGTGSMVAYFIFLGDFLPSIATSLNGGLPVWASSNDALRRFCLLASLLVVTPLALPRQLSALRYVTPVAFVALLYTVTVVVCKAPALHMRNVGEDGFGNIVEVNVDWNIFQAFSITVFAYNCHLNVVPVAAELQSASDRRISKICFRVAASQWLFYVIIAIGGYLSFLAATTQDLLESYGNGDRFMMASRILLSCTILVGIPVNVNPTVGSLLNLIDAAAAATSTGDGRGLDGNETAAGRPYPCNRGGLRHLLTLLCLALQVTVAILVPKVAVVIGYLGATVGTLMMMVIPALVLSRTSLGESYTPLLQRILRVFFIVAAIFSFVGVVVMLLQAMHVLPAAPAA